MSQENRIYKRNDSIIFRKYIQFMIPSFGTAIALSLNGFVDGIVVSQLLGSEALAVVNLGAPLMMLTSCLYTLLGVGGGVLYAREMGKKRREHAEQLLARVLLSALVLGIIGMVLGLGLRSPIVSLLARGTSFGGPLSHYVFFQMIALPVILLVMTASYFLPGMNHPAIASLTAIVANVVNLIMDVILIRYFGLGVEGAAIATMSGYVLALLMLILLGLTGKIEVPLRPGRRVASETSLLQTLTDTVKSGLSDAMIMLGFTLSWGYCNSLAAIFGGDDGVIAYSFFMQLTSIVSILVQGVGDGSIPIYAYLFGAEDTQGIHMLTRKSVFVLECLTILMNAGFLLFPDLLFDLFQISSPEQKVLGMHALIAFAIYTPIRNLIVMYRIIQNAGGHEREAIIIAVLDSLVGGLFFAFLGTRIFGIDGLWYDHIMNMLLLLTGLVIWNLIRARQTEGQIFLIYRFPKRKRTLLLDLSGKTDEESMTLLSKESYDRCQTAGIDEKICTLVSLLLEEMCYYLQTHGNGSHYVDILIWQEAEGISLDFRSSGKVCNPLTQTEVDEQINLSMIRGLASELNYAYALGLNTTTIVVRT